MVPQANMVWEKRLVKNARKSVYQKKRKEGLAHSRHELFRAGVVEIESEVRNGAMEAIRDKSIQKRAGQTGKDCKATETWGE